MEKKPRNLFKEPLFKKIIKSNRILYRFLFNLKNNNRYAFALKNFWKDTDSLFKTAVIETNPICNRRCSFCPVGLDKSEKEMMSDKLFDKILNELEKLNFYGTILLSNFGEPLLDKRLVNFIRRIKSTLGSKILIFTNGDFLTKERFEELILAGVDRITASQHDKELSSVLKNLFSEITLAQKKHLVFKIINEDTDGLCDWAESVNIKSKDPISCLVCDLQRITIRADGKVSLCCRDYYSEVIFGNINTSSIIDVWNNAAYRKIRNEIKRGIFNLPICKRCGGKIHKDRINL